MASSISSSLRLFTTKSVLTPKPSLNKLFFFYKPITFTKESPSLSHTTVSSSASTLPLQPVEATRHNQAVSVRTRAQSEVRAALVYGKNLKPLDARFKTRENKVEGCVSQVWVRAYLDGEGRNVVFEADSDSVLTKGLAALLVQGLSNRPVEEIVKVSPDLVLLGLQQSLTPSRNNGFLNMLKLMQKKAVELALEHEKADRSNDEFSYGKNSILEMKGDGGGENSKAESTSQVGSGQNLILEMKGEDLSGGSSENGSKVSGLGSRGMRIREKLERELRPVELEVKDISYLHAGHAGVRGSDGETHFNVKVVSNEFEGKSLVKRRRLIYDLLQEELHSGLHALSIVAKTPAEIEGR